MRIRIALYLLLSAPLSTGCAPSTTPAAPVALVDFQPAPVILPAELTHCPEIPPPPAADGARDSDAALWMGAAYAAWLDCYARLEALRDWDAARRARSGTAPPS